MQTMRGLWHHPQIHRRRLGQVDGGARIGMTFPRIGLGVGMAAGPAGLSRIGSELSLQHGCVIKL